MLTDVEVRSFLALRGTFLSHGQLWQHHIQEVRHWIFMSMAQALQSHDSGFINAWYILEWVSETEQRFF